MSKSKPVSDSVSESVPESAADAAKNYYLEPFCFQLIDGANGTRSDSFVCSIRDLCNVFFTGSLVDDKRMVLMLCSADLKSRSWSGFAKNPIISVQTFVELYKGK